MDYFNRNSLNQLCCEDLHLKDIAQTHSTPTYIYSKKTLTRHCSVLAAAAKNHGGMVCFAVKANSNLSLLKEIFSHDIGADVVSMGEVKKSLAAGVSPQKIIYSGVGKTAEELEFAIQTGLFSINVESVFEIKMIAEIAQKIQKNVRIALRINPNVFAQTNPKIATGMYNSKFGIIEDDLPQILSLIEQSKGLQLNGIACHIGSQICDIEPFAQATQHMTKVAQKLRSKNFPIEFVDMGGGLGVVYDNEKPPPLEDYVNCVMKPVRDIGLQPVIEIGRALIANVGGIITKIVGIKKTPVKNFVVVDAAMTELMRPTLYNAKHRIEAVKEPGDQTMKVDVVGPVCESGDYLAKEITVPADLQAGDYLLVRGCGAYAEAMGHNYNLRPLAQSILVDGSNMTVVRQKQNYQQMWQLEELS